MLWFAIWKRIFFYSGKNSRGEMKGDPCASDWPNDIYTKCFQPFKVSLKLAKTVFVAGYFSMKHPVRGEWFRQFGMISGLNGNMLCCILNSKSIMSQQSILTTQNSYKFWRKCDRTSKVKKNLKAESKTSDKRRRCESSLTGKVCVKISVTGSKAQAKHLSLACLEKCPSCLIILTFSTTKHKVQLRLMGMSNEQIKFMTWWWC